MRTIMSDRGDDLKERASGLPDEPGVYLFVGDDETIFYVGKAKSLKKRVMSYFSGTPSGKTILLLRRSHRVRHVVTSNESEALLLENNLIKKHQPRYNILLKDDKTFPWIVIKNEPFPRVYSTRQVIDDGSQYFGPFTSAGMVRTILSLFRDLYKLRTCNYHLSDENIRLGRYKLCLEYQIGNCKGPCEGLQDSDDYMESIEQIRLILKGNIGTVTTRLKGLMKEHSDALRFEEAQAIKERLDVLSRYQSRSVIVNPSVGNLDVLGFSIEGERAAVNFMRVVKGAVVQAFSVGLKNRLEEDKETLLSLAIGEVISRIGLLTNRVLVPFLPDFSDERVSFMVPRRGGRKQLLDMAQRNATVFRLEEKRRTDSRKVINRQEAILEQMGKDLGLQRLPDYIECFDISTLSGSETVASCVVFRKGKPSVKEYRHFIIREVTGSNDYASMEEVVSRRYSRIIAEGKELPALIIIDGGKGQLSSAVKSLRKIGVSDRVRVIGIAKRLEEIYFAGDKVPLYLDKNSPSLKLIQQARNEAHRFGLKLNRKRIVSESMRSVLDEISGVGPLTAERLLQNFGSVEAIREKSEEELAKVVGRQKAILIFKFFNKSVK